MSYHDCWSRALASVISVLHGRLYGDGDPLNSRQKNYWRLTACLFLQIVQLVWRVVFCVQCNTGPYCTIELKKTALLVLAELLTEEKGGKVRRPEDITVIFKHCWLWRRCLVGCCDASCLLFSWTPHSPPPPKLFVLTLGSSDWQFWFPQKN